MLTPEQLGDWVEYANREPFGFEVEDLRLGILASTVARAAGAKVAPRDFQMRPPEEMAQELTAEQEREALKKLFG